MNKLFSKYDSFISRRELLRAGSYFLSLPLLEAMNSASSFASSLKSPESQNLIFIFSPNGMHMADWTPPDSGKLKKLSPTLEPLRPYINDFSVLTGLNNDPAKPIDEPDGAHMRCGGGYLSAVHISKDPGENLKAGISVDQVAARYIGGKSVLPSLVLGLEGGASAGSCDAGYSCAYARNISWRSANTPVPKDTNPRVVFQRIVGATGASAAQLELRSSILDFVKEESSRLVKQISTRDTQKLEEYLESIRDLEKRLDSAGNLAAGGACRSDKIPPTDLPFEEKVRTMYQLVSLALNCQRTKIVTLMLGNAASDRSYGFLGISGGHHEISHHLNQQDKFDKLKKINHWTIQQFAYFLKLLKESRQVDGNSLLDCTTVVFGCGMSDGNSHSPENLPLLIAGGSGRTVPLGQHLQFPKGTQLASLYLSILRKNHIELERFGNAVQSLPAFGGARI